MPKLLVCLLCLLCAAGCAQTGPNSYGMDVDTIIKGISQGKLVVNSTEVVEANFEITGFYGNSRDPGFEYDYDSGLRIKDGYILGDFRNDTKKPMKLVMVNYWRHPQADEYILENETVTDIIKPGQKVTIKIQIPEGLGKVEYMGSPYEAEV